MNEQANQNTTSNEQIIDDDPLAELARIVAGGPEITDPKITDPEIKDNVQPVADPVKPEPDLITEEMPNDFGVETDSVEMDSALDDALKSQLEKELSSLNMETPDFVDDINASVEEIKSAQATSNLDEMLVETHAPVETEAAQVPEPDQIFEHDTVSGEDAFQDDLISALENELVTETVEEPVMEQPTPEIAEPQIAEPQEVVSQAFAEQPMVEKELSLEEALMAEMSEAVEASQEAPEMLEVEEANIQQPVEASLEDDLGAAFASEFEQLNSRLEEGIELEGSELPEDVQIEQEPPVLAAGIEALPAMDPNLEANLKSHFEPVREADLEIDFEAAFAEELQATTPNTDRLTEIEVPAENVVAFQSVRESTQPSLEINSQEIESTQQSNIEDFIADYEMADPGHVGSVDEIAAVSANETETASKGGGMKYAAAALIIALFAGTIATGYGFLGSGQNSTIASLTPEVIKADENPVKIKPEDPGGFVPENQDNASYSDLGGENNIEVSQKELVSTTEEPASLNTQVAGVQPKSDDRLAPSENADATPNAVTPSVSPKVVQTVVVKPDGTIINNPAPAPKPVETASTSVTNSQPPIVQPETVETTPVAAQQGIEGAVTTGAVKVPTASPLPKPAPKPVQQAAVAKPKPAPKPAAPAPAARKSEWVVQVSSQRTPEAAQSSFNNMRNRFAALQGRAMSIQRANVNGSTFYRVRVQTESRDDANRLCSNLATAGGSCFVTR